MRILFVSGTASGGSALSTAALAERLAGRGHDIGILQRVRRSDFGLRAPASTSVVRGAPAKARRGVERLVARRRHRAVAAGHGPLWRTRHLEAVVADVVATFSPDVIVVNTVHERAWGAVRDEAERTGTPIVLYIREEDAVGHVGRGARPDLVVTNARSHAAAVAEHGVPAVVVPSIVETERLAVPESRSTVLFVNPIPSRGLTTAIEIARCSPELRFAFQESHVLDRRDQHELARRLAGLDNVTLRPYTADLASIYRDARVLLVPYLVANRPRVVLEAQAIGIPVVAVDRPGLDECVRPGGVLVPADAPASAWVDAIACVTDDPDRYDAFVAAALEHSRRDEVDPALLTERFEAALGSVVAQT